VYEIASYMHIQLMCARIHVHVHVIVRVERRFSINQVMIFCSLHHIWTTFWFNIYKSTKYEVSHVCSFA